MKKLFLLLLLLSSYACTKFELMPLQKQFTVSKSCVVAQIMVDTAYDSNEKSKILPDLYLGYFKRTVGKFTKYYENNDISQPKIKELKANIDKAISTGKYKEKYEHYALYETLGECTNSGIKLSEDFKEKIKGVRAIIALYHLPEEKKLFLSRTGGMLC